MDYDDDLELTQYVWIHFNWLMTDFERRVGKAINGRLKAAHAKGTVSHLLLTRWGAIEDPEINAALADGSDTFRRQVRIRVLAESGDKVFINRCSVCGRIVRTPKAKQCFWCGHNWH